MFACAIGAMFDAKDFSLLGRSHVDEDYTIRYCERIAVNILRVFVRYQRIETRRLFPQMLVLSLI